MGFRIENYTRDDLRKVALPGHAVSTLFWVLPIGHWKMGELDRWWNFFTQRDGYCQQLGLLLVRDLSRNQIATDTANLASPLATADGGSLLELIPELEVHSHDLGVGINNRHTGLLVLTGAYPQPGWGVFIPLGKNMQDAQEFEELVAEVVEKSCEIKALNAIRSAGESYHLRQGASLMRPRPPGEPTNLQELLQAQHGLQDLFNILQTETQPELQRAFATVRSIPYDKLGVEGLSAQRWSDLHGAANLPKEMASFLKDGESAWVELAALHDACDDQSGESFLQTASPREKSFLKKLRFLRGKFPGLAVQGLVQWLEAEYRTHLKREIQGALALMKSQIESKTAEIAVEHERTKQRYESQQKSWTEKVRQAEETFRNSLAEATLAQWNLGPGFLMELEKIAYGRGLGARSVPWDAPRMVGWKLHVSTPGIQGQDLLIAANSVLPAGTTHVETSFPKGDFTGSLFADFAYYAAMSAQRLSPWQATRHLLVELLGAGQLLKLVNSEGQNELPLSNSKEQLVQELLHKWGWRDQPPDMPRPLAACIGTQHSKQVTLTKPLNDTRISLEGCLKDLVRITITTMGWRDQDLDDSMAVHCSAYNKPPHRSWSQELEKLTAGGSLILLRELLPLAFPQDVNKDAALNLCKKASSLLNDLNSGSHDPPPPPPSPEQLSAYAKTILELLETISGTVGEMPWHLKPTQVFGSEPAVATGHAWSHSHPEERLIRVMLWAGTRPASQMLVWNRSKTNPVMTDAVLL
jgi:hypothetical protein